MQFIHVQNDFNQSIHIISKNSLEKIIEIKKNNVIMLTAIHII